MKDEERVLLKMISGLEQAQAGLAQLATVLGDFYKALCKNGIPKDLARELVTIWFTITLDSSRPK